MNHKQKLERVASLNRSIQCFILNGTYGLVEKPYERSRSLVWDTFLRIQKPNGNIIENAVCCRFCQTVHKYNGRQTTNLTRHRCCRKRLDSAAEAKEKKKILIEGEIETTEILKVHNKKIYQGKIISEQSKQIAKNPEDLKPNDVITDILYNWIIKDLQPLSVVNKSGFKEMVKYLIEFRAQHSCNIESEIILPDSTFLQSDIDCKAEERKLLLKDILQEKINEGICITYSIWSNDIIKKNILSISLHYIDFTSIEDVLLCVKCFKSEKRASPDIEQEIRNILHEFNIENYGKIIFVSQKISNTNSIFSSSLKTNCAINLLNEVLNKAFEETKELIAMLNACENLLESIKISNLNLASPNFKIYYKNNYQCSATVWLTQYSILKTIHENWNLINQFFVETNAMEKLDNIKTIFLKDVIDICEHCENILSKLETPKVANLQYVYTSINFLKKICTPNIENSDNIEKFKENILNGINEIWVPNLSILHKLALFLFPPTNQLKLFNSLEIEEIKNFCLQQIIEHTTIKCNENKDKNDDSSMDTVNITDLDKFSDSIMFSDLINNSGDNEITKENQIKLEISKYSSALVDYHENFNVIKWWLDYKKDYKFLYPLSQRIFCVPAGAVASDKIFLRGKHLLIEDNNTFNSKTAGNILFLNFLSKDQDI